MASTEYTDNDDVIATYRKCDTDAVPVADDPQAGNTAVPYRTTFGKCLQAFQEGDDAIDEIAGNACSCFCSDMVVDRVEFGLRFRRVDDAVAQELLAFRRVALSFGFEPGAHILRGNSDGRILQIRFIS